MFLRSLTYCTFEMARLLSSLLAWAVDGPVHCASGLQSPLFQNSSMVCSVTSILKQLHFQHFLIRATFSASNFLRDQWVWRAAGARFKVDWYLCASALKWLHFKHLSFETDFADGYWGYFKGWLVSLCNKVDWWLCATWFLWLYFKQFQPLAGGVQKLCFK